jgi:hypothetical protein
VDLTRDNANKITCVNESAQVVIPDNTFVQGDLLMLFNNTDRPVLLESRVASTYKSGCKVTLLTWPAKTLANVVFIQDAVAVVTVEDV